MCVKKTNARLLPLPLFCIHTYFYSFVETCEKHPICPQQKYFESIASEQFSTGKSTPGQTHI